MHAPYHSRITLLVPLPVHLYRHIAFGVDGAAPGLAAMYNYDMQCHMANLRISTVRAVRHSLTLLGSSHQQLEKILPGNRNNSQRTQAELKFFNLRLAGRSSAILPTVGRKNQLRKVATMADGGSHEAKFSNRLAKEQSPYLLQHAHNPVKKLTSLSFALQVYKVGIGFCVFSKGKKKKRKKENKCFSASQHPDCRT